MSGPEPPEPRGAGPGGADAGAAGAPADAVAAGGAGGAGAVAAGGADAGAGAPADAGAGVRPSGLRNPPAAVRGAGAGALAAMALVLLMGIVPLVRLDAPGAAVVVIAVLAGLAIVLCGLLKRDWAWYVAILIPATLLATSFLHVALGVLGVLFALLWAYMLHVRRTVLR